MELNQDTIRRLAHKLWEAGGRRNDSHESDWLRAEQLVREAQQSASRSNGVDESGRESFPASDPPSTHSADSPVSNAADKWARAKKET